MEIQKHQNTYNTCLYYSNWSIYEAKYLPKDIPWDLVSHLFYCFADIDTDGSIKFQDPWADFQIPMEGRNGLIEELNFRKGNCKVLLSIGGWSNRENFASLCDERKRHNFIESAVDNMRNLGFDGLDIDWEYPKNCKEARALVNTLQGVKHRLLELEVSLSLPKHTYVLSLACPAFAEKLDILDILEMDKYLTFWNMMTYDFAGEWSETVEYHCNLYGANSADSAMRYMLNKGVFSRKLNLGMPLYGRSFTNTKGHGCKYSTVGRGSGEETGIWNYKFLPLPNSQEHFDSKQGCAWCYDGNTWISYDNTSSTIMKAQYVVANRLGGGMWWEACGDKKGQESLLQVFSKHIK